MNIQLTQINNGWILTVAGPQGQSCQYYTTWGEAVAEINKMPIKDAKANAGPTRKG